MYGLNRKLNVIWPELILCGCAPLRKTEVTPTHSTGREGGHKCLQKYLHVTPVARVHRRRQDLGAQIIDDADQAIPSKRTGYFLINLLLH